MPVLVSFMTISGAISDKNLFSGQRLHIEEAGGGQ